MQKALMYPHVAVIRVDALLPIFHWACLVDEIAVRIVDLKDLMTLVFLDPQHRWTDANGRWTDANEARKQASLHISHEAIRREMKFTGGDDDGGLAQVTQKGGVWMAGVP